MLEKINWDSVEEEQLNPSIKRKMIWGEKIDHKTMNVQSKKGETWQLILYALPENVTKIEVVYVFQSIFSLSLSFLK